MSKLKNKKRGLSLIELVVALSLITIILMIVGPFFISNYKSLNKTSNQIDFQRESKVIMNSFKDTALEASNIFKIKDRNNVIKLNENSTWKSDNMRIIFQNNQVDSQGVGDLTQFILEDGIMYYKKNSEKRITLGKNIIQMEVTATPNSDVFKNANGIELTLTFDAPNVEQYKISDILTFRNKK